MCGFRWRSRTGEHWRSTFRRRRGSASGCKGGIKGIRDTLHGSLPPAGRSFAQADSDVIARRAARGKRAVDGGREACAACPVAHENKVTRFTEAKYSVPLCGRSLRSAMKIDIVTIFPDFFHGPLDYGIIRRARESSLVTIEVHDLRAFAHDRHRTVDDRPFGGGEGMVLKPEPIFECVEMLNVTPRGQRMAQRSTESIILLSAQGQRFDQNVAQELAALERIILICGRYEGVDERVSDFLADRDISI